MNELYGGIEAGGTKFVCAVGRSPDEVIAEIRFSTTTPEETIQQAIRFFQQYHQDYPLKALGVASFGPVDLIPGSETFGFITKTPKPGWSDTDLISPLRRAFGLPV